MYFKLLSLLLLAVYVKAADQDPNQLCPCDNEESIKENDLLRKFLLELVPEGELTEEQKDLAAVYPGILYQLGCGRCVDKIRRKRKIISEPESAEASDVYTVKEKRSSHIGGANNNCPQDYVRISILCIPKSDIEDYSDEN